MHKIWLTVTSPNDPTSDNNVPQLTEDEILQQEEWKKQCIEVYI